MSSASQPVTLLVAALLAVAGCRGQFPRGGCPVRELFPVAPRLDCQPVEPAERLPDLSELPEGGPSVAEQPEPTWCGLNEDTTRHLAAAHSPAANMLVREAALVQWQFAAQHSQENAEQMAGATIRLIALEQRNRSASQALQLLLRLAEVQEIGRHVDHSLAEVQEMLRDLRTLEEQGITAPVTAEEIEAQRLDLLIQQSDLDRQSRRLNDQLHEMLGEVPHASRQFWPELSMRVEYREWDADQLAAEAQVNRPELRALRLALGQPAASLGRLAEALIPAVAPGAGLSSGVSDARPRLRRDIRREEGETRRRQLQGLLDYRERVVQREVLEAVRGIEQGYARIGWAQKQLELAERELAMAVEEQRVASGSPLEVRRSRIKVFLSRQQVLREVIEWKVQRVKLEEAQGKLANGS